MNTFVADSKAKVHILHMGPQEDVLEQINVFIKKENIKNGVIISGIGSLSKVSFHAVSNTVFPPKDEFYVFEDAPTELCSACGIIADYVPHIHMALSISKGKGNFDTFVAHIEPGCKVFCLAEFAIMELENVEMQRIKDADNINQLTGKYLGTET